MGLVPAMVIRTPYVTTQTLSSHDTRRTPHCQNWMHLETTNGIFAATVPLTAPLRSSRAHTDNAPAPGGRPPRDAHLGAASAPTTHTAALRFSPCQSDFSANRAFAAASGRRRAAHTRTRAAHARTHTHTPHPTCTHTPVDAHRHIAAHTYHSYLRSSLPNRLPVSTIRV